MARLQREGSAGRWGGTECGMQVSNVCAPPGTLRSLVVVYAHLASVRLAPQPHFEANCHRLDSPKQAPGEDLCACDVRTLGRSGGRRTGLGRSAGQSSQRAAGPDPVSRAPGSLSVQPRQLQSPQGPSAKLITELAFGTKAWGAQEMVKRD